MSKKSAVRALYLASAAVLAANLAVATPARGNLVITPTFDSTITSDPNAATVEAAINATIARVEAVVTTNVSSTITFSEMSSGLGESTTSHYTVAYSTYVAALQSQQTLSTNDATAIASLAYNPAITTNNPVDSNASVYVNTTLARALGIANYGGSDGTVSLNTSICNISRTGTQNGSFYDLQAVAGHEIDEVLGIGGPGSTLPNTTGPVGVLDLYRYASSGVRSFTTSASVNAYFSINGGVKNLVYFDQNNEGADFSDWGNGTPNAEAGNSPAQLQDSFGTPGVDTNIGINEATALDVVGYNVNYAFAPEPGSIGLLATLGVAGLLRRRKRRSV
jgi:hypothetical protein